MKKITPLLKKNIGSLALAVALSLGFAHSANAYQVQAGKVYDDMGQRVHINGINWFGFETTSHAPHGLWARNADDMIAQMKSVGITAVRLPVGPGTLHAQGVTSVDFSLNPNLAGLNGLQTFDYIINKLDQAGIYILLDHHHPDDYEISELWYTDWYSETQWIADLVFMADRYKNVPHVFGIDLKNEPHGRVTWGTGNVATDWNLAAERASTAVLAKNPSLVVFVAGIDEQATCSSAHAHGWGGNLEPLRCMPLNIPQNKLVLTPHFYGPDVYMYSYFNAPDFPLNMPAIWNTNFGFAKDLGYAVIPTEFGSRYGHDGGLALDKIWFDAAIDWMVQKDLRDGFFWSWNPNSSNTGGLLQNDWMNIWTDKLAKLHTLWGMAASTPAPIPAPTPVPEPTPAPTPTPVPNPSPAPAIPALTGNEIEVQRNVDSDWGSGYCVTYTVRNASTHEGTWATTFGFRDHMDNGWNATLSIEGTSIKAKGAGWNDILQAGASAQYGYCASRAQPGTGGVTSSELPAQLTVLADWGAGYCTSVRVSNTTSDVLPWSTRFAVQGTIAAIWGASMTQSGSQASAQGESWNAYLQPGAVADFGFCMNR